MISEIKNIIADLRKDNFSFTIVSSYSSIIILVKTSSEDKVLEFYYNNSKEPYKEEKHSNLDLKIEFKEGKYEEEVRNYIINNLLLGRCNSIKSYKGTEVAIYPTHIKDTIDENIIINSLPTNDIKSGTSTGKIDGDGTSYYNILDKNNTKI